MKKREKLFDAIGQIDDKYIEEAAHAGQSKKKKAGRKSTRLYRWQGALAACAVLAVCVGFFALAQRNGLLLSPFGNKAEAPSAKPEAAAELADEAAEMAEMAAADVAEMTDDTALAERTAGEMADNTTEAAGNAEDTAVTKGVVPAEAKMERIAETAVEEVSAEEKIPVQSRQGRSAAGSDAAGFLQAAVRSSSAQSVTFELTNTTADKNISHGAAWYLEMLAEGEWQPVAVNKEVCWDDILYEVPAGEQIEETVYIDDIYENLDAGQYRIVMYCEIAEQAETKEDAALAAEKYPFYVEFEITE